MRPLKIVSVIFGIVLVLVGVASVTAGGFVLGVCRSYGSTAGFFSAPSQTIGSHGFALTVPDVNGQLAAGWERWVLARAAATMRLTGSSKLPAPVFIGVGPTDQVSEYLSGVARDRITRIDIRSGSVAYDHVNGKRLPSSPQKQDFWVAAATGAGSQTLQWTLREGDWAVVIMNGDASAPVAADVRLSARFGITYPLIAGLAIVGFLLSALGVTLLVFGSRRRMSPVPGRARVAARRF